MTYTFAVSRRSLPVRCLCVLLCLLVLWCFFMVPRAGAVVAEAELAYWGGAIVVSVLAAGGLALASGDASKVGAAMWTALKDTGGKAYDSIAAMAAWAASAGTKVKDAAFRVGKDVWQAISDCFSKFYSDGSFSALSSAASLTRDNAESVFYAFNYSRQTQCAFLDAGGSFWTVSIKVYDNYSSDIVFSKDSVVYATYGFTDWEIRDRYLNFHYSGSGHFGTYWGFYEGDVLNTVGGYHDVGVSIPADGGLTFYTAVSVPVSVTGDLVYPGDDYLVKAPDLPAVDTATGAVTWPQGAVWTKDAVSAPYPVGDDGVKVPDIPFDVPVDGITGKALDDAGSDTDSPSKPGEGEGAETGTTAGLIGSIIELLRNFFDSPSDFRLNLDGFKELILPDRFPFSIPFDMVKAVELFAAAAADFVFRIDLDTQYFSVHHTVDLTPYAVPIAFFRYACVFWFAWILISRTHDLIKW